MHHLSIDIETFSSVDIQKSGLYKYVQSPDFEVLLFAFSYDGSPVEIIDLASGGFNSCIPLWLINALKDPNTIKHAYNASFEWYCLSKFLKFQPSQSLNWLSQWQCTMFHGLYCGYPGKLSQIGEALNLPQDKKKLGIGSALIKVFCVPCAPTAKNGNRTRTLPHHEPDKWALFKKYCCGDVVTEMEVEARLSSFPVPENEHDLWQLDQMLNAYGVAVDKELIDSALYCDEVTTNQLMQEAASITKLDNPKSPTQVKKWLSDELDEEVTSLTKESVKDLLKLHNDETITRVLEIRQELAKTSTKKYVAMDKAVCNDGRIRGLLQIYGANRTGRWAGRLVQVHNLPQNHLPVIEWARDSIKARRIDDIKAIYGNIPDTLSQLIRTAFIPSPGYVLIPADFSAIEARIIAWLAGEQWRLDVFATHGKIYEASAAAMFGVPVESIKKGDPLRQKGKVAELACIAEGQLVLTDIGLVPIEKVTTSMLIWDGEEFVSHDGAMFRGIKEVITYDGLTATADHLVWIEGETRPIRFDKSAASGARLKRPAINWADIRKCGNNQPGKKMENRLERSLRINKMPQLWKYPMDALLQFATRKVKGLSALLTTKTNTKMVRPKIYSSKTALHKSKGRKLLKLWRAWNSFLLQLRTRSRFMDDRELRTTRERIGNRPDQYKWQLRAGKPSLGNTSNKLCQSAPVYDIINCGPRNRYTVNGALVHNCGYQGSIGALKAMGADKMGLSDEELKQIIYRWRQANKRIVDLWYTVENAALSVMKTGQPAGINKGIIIARESDSQNGQDFLTIRLLSGRKLYYVRPFIQPNDFGRESLNYWGLNQETKKWQVMETYGGKLVENIVQAIARDCLAVNLQRITEAGYKAPFHVHDEIITEAPENEAEKHLDYICNLMGQPIAWAPGLLLRADGFVTKFYMKEG